MNKRDLQKYKKLIEAERQAVLQKLGMIESELGPLAIYRAVKPSRPQERILQALGVSNLPLHYQPN